MLSECYLCSNFFRLFVFGFRYIIYKYTAFKHGGPVVLSTSDEYEHAKSLPNDLLETFKTNNFGIVCNMLKRELTMHLPPTFLSFSSSSSLNELTPPEDLSNTIFGNLAQQRRY